MEAACAGTVLLEGKVACDCGRCRGKAVSCSEFEEHAGSHDRRPAESILLVDACLTLKDLCAMVRLHAAVLSCRMLVAGPVGPLCIGRPRLHAAALLRPSCCQGCLCAGVTAGRCHMQQLSNASQRCCTLTAVHTCPAWTEDCPAC